MPRSLMFFLVFLLVTPGVQLRADQNAPALPALFKELGAAGTSAEAVELESRIWSLWLQAPDAASKSRLEQVVLAMQGGKLEAALMLCNELIAAAPDFAEGFNKRATIHYLLGQHDRSVTDIGNTLKLEPRHFGAISGLGLIFLQRGDLEAALEAFDQVLEISPQSANARRSAERVRSQLGREI